MGLDRSVVDGSGRKQPRDEQRDDLKKLKSMVS